MLQTLHLALWLAMQRDVGIGLMHDECWRELLEAESNGNLVRVTTKKAYAEVAQWARETLIPEDLKDAKVTDDALVTLIAPDNRKRYSSYNRSYDFVASRGITFAELRSINMVWFRDRDTAMLFKLAN